MELTACLAIKPSGRAKVPCRSCMKKVHVLMGFASSCTCQIQADAMNRNPGDYYRAKSLQTPQLLVRRYLTFRPSGMGALLSRGTTQLGVDKLPARPDKRHMWFHVTLDAYVGTLKDCSRQGYCHNFNREKKSCVKWN